jgi:ABC-type sugar transport system ATPase subunit
MKIIAGVHSGYSGTMRIEGRDVQFRSARDALAAGIGMVHQELSIAPDLTVAENVFLGMQPVKAGGIVDWKRMVRESRDTWPGSASTCDPRASDRFAVDRASAADRDRPRAVLRRPHHHPGRAHLALVAAGSGAAV